MKITARLVIYSFFFISAFYLGYRLTDVWFRVKLVPYPFELYGIAAGLALMAWSFSLLQLAELLGSKFFKSKKTDKAYTVKAEHKLSEVELFK